VRDIRRRWWSWGRAHGRTVLWPAVALVIAVAVLLSACGSAGQPQAEHNRAQLDQELAHAQKLGIPSSMLQPIEKQEAQVAAGAGGWNYSYQNAASNYELLYNQLLGIEQTSLATLKQQASDNVAAFGAILATRKAQGFVEITAYEPRLNQAQQQLASATTQGDYAAVASFAQTQEQALQAMWPAYQKLQDFRTELGALQQVGIDTSWSQAMYTSDLEIFRDAASPDRYNKLSMVIDGQVNQLVADKVEALPYVGQAMLGAFQSRINLLATFGEQTRTFQQQHDADVKQLSSATTLADFITLSQLISKQGQAMTLPMARGQARHDLDQLHALINSVTQMNPLLDYEYADASVGVGDADGWFQQAPLQYTWNPTCGWDVVCRYGLVDTEVTQMETNLRAMLDNLRDPTPAWEPHATDLELMKQYGILGGQVTIVSLREQTMRAYDNGKLVYWSYITTGRFERPSPPGVQYTLSKATHVEFLPTEPIGSPIRGYPTPINFAVNYNSPFWYQFDGFFLHEAWWRIGFGPGSNLPHWDPAAFNGGSHGCINFPLQNMAWYYSWVNVGTPVVIY
jgi:L,D-transpeptidase catalytic domain